MKKILWASILAVAPLLAQASDELTIDNVGYDVAAGALVIHGSNFVTRSYRAPVVRIGEHEVRVTYYIDDLVVVEAPVGLRRGQHTVTVTPAGGRETASLQFVMAVPVPYVITPPPSLFARR